MAKHKVITIKVAYDEAEPVPMNDDLKYAVEYAVGRGMLTDGDGAVEEYSVEVTDAEE